jgi:hypothetical protein
VAEHVGSLRRYYLLKSRFAASVGSEAVALAFRGKQRAESGTDLPDGFPVREALLAAGYEAIEDVTGASVEELIDAGLTTREANAVLAAL